MSGDYGKDSFDALKSFAGVFLQQGRAVLDSDWNEMVVFVKVVEQGSCREIAGVGLSVAGKTGTADLEERLGTGEEMHSFVALCPAEDPLAGLHRNVGQVGVEDAVPLLSLRQPRPGQRVRPLLRRL